MERLQYKIKNGPRVESVNEFTLNDNTIVAMFQGFRGSYPELDFIVKYNNTSYHWVWRSFTFSFFCKKTNIGLQPGTWFFSRNIFVCLVFAVPLISIFQRHINFL